MEYLKLPQEPAGVVENNRPPAYWPSTTSTSESMITVKDLVIKYAPSLPAVLHGVSFDVKPREKIGLLGRTGESWLPSSCRILLKKGLGSGKSTLAMALLRFVDPIEGSIWIDGMNIQEIGLQDLRSRLVCSHSHVFWLLFLQDLQTFIPQDSVLFTGTIRLVKKNGK